MDWGTFYLNILMYEKWKLEWNYFYLLMCNFCLTTTKEGDVSPFDTAPKSLSSKSAKNLGEKSGSDLDNDDL